MDIVSHDVRKFFGLLLKKNGYVLEQLFSPLIVHTTPEHAELKEICRARPTPRSSRGNEAHALDPERSRSLLTSAATGVITKHHSHHYFGFAETQWKLFLKESPRRVKPLLYVYRVLPVMCFGGTDQRALNRCEWLDEDRSKKPPFHPPNTK